MSYPHQSRGHEIYELKESELPVYCPSDKKELKYEHPKVFIPMTTGQGICPYCGAVYKLSGKD